MMSAESNKISIRKNLLSAHEMKEFQNLAAVVAYSMHPKDMPEKELQKAIFETCHGDEDTKIALQLKLIVSGEDKVYSNLWERVGVGHQQSNLLPSYERVLKKIYSPTFGKTDLYPAFK